MLSGYRTLAATGRILGVSAKRVLDLIERGPLVGRVFDNGELLVHAEDLAAFRRPHPASAFPGYSTLCQLNATETEENREVREKLHLATVRARGVATRNTSASASFRALQDLGAVAGAAARFDNLVTPEPNTGCLLWLGACEYGGYGQFRVARVLVYAHRFAWVRANGRIGENLDVDHVCCQRSCVNPAHLEALSHADNLKRRDARLAERGTHNMVAAHAALRESSKTRKSHLRLVVP